ncbi:MAG: hypothetical protein M3069_30650 [Chloroflexota bacterium]|nr:hypothetical protein [Chloroflexota bacterium]
MHDEPRIPIACTLSSDQATDRQDEFFELFSTHLRELTRPAPRQARLVFEPAAAIEDATRDLFARERECCAFFDFGVQRQGTQLIVYAQVPAGAEDNLDGLVTIAGRAAPLALA